MSTINSRQFFFRCVAWSWFVFGIISVVIELFRPSFVGHLIPIWVIFVVAGVSGAYSIKK